jgi:transglutaminase-like putative cysteine protease
MSINFKSGIILTALWFILINPGFSAETRYKVSEIQPDLLRNSKAVVRTMKVNFKVISARMAEQEVFKAITIINKNAHELSYFTGYYNKFIRISEIKGKVYDKDGELIKKLTTADVDDYSAIQGFSIYEDSRVKFIDPEVRDYPFTIEYSYKISYNGLIDYPEWQIYPDYNVAVESAEFHLVIPSSTLSSRMYYANLVCETDSMIDGQFKYFHWKISNKVSLNSESYSRNLAEYTPVLYLAPDSFEIQGVAGNSCSWKTLGLWVRELNKGKDTIPPETAEKIREMVADKNNLFDKVCIIYKYLQDKTRYANISIGLGGWQPYDAQTVDRLSYGDCKALSNYMMTLLKTAGIRSYYTLVHAGSDAPDLISGFPSQQFNHAMLCIPAEPDTIWIECTSQTLPCGYIGTFTDDRDVLVITDQGGEIWHTKMYSKDQNTQVRKAFVKLSPDGSGTANIFTSFSGVLYDKMDWIYYTDQSDKRKRLNETIRISEFTLEDYQYKENKDIIPSIQETLDLSFNNYSAILGESMILPLNLMNKVRDIPKRTEQRVSEIRIRRSFTETDSIIYKIPIGYHVETLPDPVTISGRFGNYSAGATTVDNEIIYVRYFSLDKGLYPPYVYPELIDFLSDVVIADELKLVLKHN